MKVSELEGVELDYLVGEATGMLRAMSGTKEFRLGGFSPSTKWQHGGPIIDSEQISVQCTLNCPPVWRATVRNCKSNQAGNTPLLAAMRAFVASKFGDEIPSNKCHGSH